MRRSACDTHVFVGLVLLLACTTWGTAQNTNYEKIALLKVYPGIQTSSAFSVGAGPRGMAFDGDNIWVTNSGSNSVTKLHASNGAVQGTFSVGDSPRGVAFDGVNIWVANYGSGTVAFDGANNLGGKQRRYGANIWD